MRVAISVEMHYNIMDNEKEAEILAEWNISSPLLNDMQIVDRLSDVGGVATYLIKNDISEKNYIFKCISIPESQTQVEGLRYSGAIQTAGEAQAYYERVVADYKAEIETLKRLSDCGSIDCYKVHHIQPKDEAVGFDLHLLAPYRKTLAEYIQQTPMTHLKTVNLALDLCTALKDLRHAGYIHCNIKPENIYLNNQGHFMLGDLGLYRADQLKYAAVPERMLSKFSAPELFDIMQTPNTTADIYTVALILYSIYNGGHRPYEDERTSTKGASQQRLSGTPLPAPLYADYEMTEILLKACAFDPADRYQTPDDLFEALTGYAQRNQPQDELIVPPIVLDEDVQLTEEALAEEVVPVNFTDTQELGEEFIHHFSPDTETHQEIAETIQEEIAAEESAVETEAVVPEEPTAEPVTEAEVPDASAAEEMPEETVVTAPKKQRKKVPAWIWITGGAAALIIGGLAAVYFLLIPNVTAITPVVTGSHSLSFSVESNKSIDAFSATCSDTYGNVKQAQIMDGTLVFESLDPGTQYSIELKTAQGYMVRGTDKIMASTCAATEILFFGAMPVSETQVELNFSIAGADQETWTVQYGTNELDMMQTEFSGHSVLISDLLPNTQYTFTLLSSGAVSLTGKTQIIYHSTILVSIDQLIAQTSAEEVILTWNYTGDAPQQWHVICRGPEDFFLEQTVAEPRAVFSGLQTDKVYTMEVFCDGMAMPSEKTIRTADATISDLTATEGTDGSISLSWTSQDELPDGWMVVCSLVSDPSIVTTITTDKTTAVLTGLLPEANYRVEVQTGSGMKVNGDATLEVTAGKASKYNANGLTSTYVGLFREPESQSWTYRNLASPKTNFASSESIAFAMEAMSAIRNSSDTIDVMVVVSDAQKNPVSIKTYIAVWDEMWDNKLFVGTPAETPAAAGKYTISIYFDGALAGSAGFSVTQ